MVTRLAIAVQFVWVSIEHASHLVLRERPDTIADRWLKYHDVHDRSTITMETHIVYLALGSNLGDRQENLRQAIGALPPQMDVKSKSHVYETPPWGYENQPKFFNQVIKADTYLQPEPLLKHLKRLEVALGRQPNFQNGPRLIDIDILFYDHLVLDTPVLTIPHPRLHERGFVLLPLMDIAPEFIHPVMNKSIRELAASSKTEGIIQVP